MLVKFPKSLIDKAIKIVWLDACFRRGWLTKEQVEDLSPTRVIHIGFVYAIRKDFIIMIGAKNDVGQLSEAHAIRMSDIVELKVLK